MLSTAKMHDTQPAKEVTLTMPKTKPIQKPVAKPQKPKPLPKGKSY